MVVLTIISLVMFFVLTGKQNESGKNSYAEMEVNFVELVLYIVTTISVLVAMFRLRSLKYERKIGTSFTFNKVDLLTELVFRSWRNGFGQYSFNCSANWNVYLLHVLHYWLVLHYGR